MALLFGGGIAGAQEMPRPQGDAARFQWGPLRWTPRISVTNVGVDTNVFNSAGEPVRDFTATVSPGADSWVRFGPAQLSLSSTVGWTYFRESKEERSFSFDESGRFDLLFNRVAPFIIGNYSTYRRRPNFEIDERVREKSQRLGVGTTVRVGGRTSLEVLISHALRDYGDEDFGNPLIADALNRETRQASLTIARELTPLTTARLAASVSRDRFDVPGPRDSNSFSIAPSLAFNPLALIAGDVVIGYRRFDVIDPTVPDFQGIIAATNVSYILREMTRFAFNISRDVDYSIDEVRPYSIVTNAGGSITQVVGLNWYLEGRGSRAVLNYRGTDAAVGARQERVTTWGGSISRRLGENLFVGVAAEHSDRNTGILERAYEGWRVGGTFTYGN